MKKVALSFMALALIGGGAFAQSVASAATIGGYLNVGTNTVINSDSGTSTTFKGDDTGSESFDLKGAFALSPKAGVKFSIRTSVAGNTDYYKDTNTNVIANNAYLYFTVPGVDALTILAGNIDGSGWGGNDDNGPNVSGGNGIQAKFVAGGLTIGGQYHAVGIGARTPGIESFGATYVAEKAATLVVGVKTGVDKSNATALNTGYVTAAITAVDGLTLKGGLQMDGLAGDNAATTTIDATLGYKLSDALSTAVTAYVYTYGSKIIAQDSYSATNLAGSAAALSYKVNPSVSYTVDAVTSLGLGVTYQSGYSLAKMDKHNRIDVKPSLGFQIDANTKVNVSYDYAINAGDSVKTDKTVQTFVTDFRYSF